MFLIFLQKLLQQHFHFAPEELQLHSPAPCPVGPTPSHHATHGWMTLPVINQACGAQDQHNFFFFKFFASLTQLDPFIRILPM